MSVTIKDIAMLAGVSHQAVSAALNGNGSSRVSAVKKEKILKIAMEFSLEIEPGQSQWFLLKQQTQKHDDGLTK